MKLYEELICQFEELSDEEKNAFLVYKSRLGLAMNALEDKEIEEIYLQYKKLLTNPKNMFLKLSVFKDISFVDFVSFKESLNRIKSVVEKATEKIFLPEATTVYRVVSVPNSKNLENISKSNLISTSLDMNACGKFLIKPLGGGYTHYLYQIFLEKNSRVGICPYAILLDEKEERLIVTQKRDQLELILLKENYVFEEILSSKICLQNGLELNRKEVHAHSCRINKEMQEELKR